MRICGGKKIKFAMNQIMFISSKIMLLIHWFENSTFYRKYLFWYISHGLQKVKKSLSTKVTIDHILLLFLLMILLIALFDFVFQKKI